MRLCHILIFVSTFLFVSAQLAHAIDDTIIVEAVGEATGNDLEAPRELFERAKAEAQRVALEQAIGIFLRSHAIVSDNQLVEDLTYTKVRGKIDKLETLLRERDPKDPNVFRVKIRAFVKPLYPEMNDGIAIKAALTREIIRVGDEIKMFIQTNSDSYVYIFVVGADNSVTQLLPNSLVKQNFIRAGDKMVFPPDGSELKLKVMPLPGFNNVEVEEKVKIIATKKPEPLLSIGFQEGLKVHDANTTGMISDLLKRLVQLDPQEWGEFALIYKILPEGKAH